MNNLHPNIRFTIETKEQEKLPFLDVLVFQKGDGILGHKVYRKLMHFDLYLNVVSCHHPEHNRTALFILIHCGNMISNKESPQKELDICARFF